MKITFKQTLLFSCLFGATLPMTANQTVGQALVVNQQAKKGTVKGKVVDTEGEPIIGASVKVKGSNVATVTDIDGLFSINAPLNSTLEISYIGFTSQTVKVANKETVSVVMVNNSKLLDDVIVVGYGTTSVRKNSAALTSVDNAKVMKVPFSDMGSTLQGRVAGVIVQQGSAEPGQNGASVSIRGNGTPLYVIDGFVSNATQFNQLNKADIESMTVLKDAASTAVYGMNAGNGVIVVTTKKGKSGKLTLDYQSNFAWNTPSYMADRMDAYEYSTAVNNLWQGIGYGINAFKTPEEMADIKKNVNSYTNWEKIMMKSAAPQSEHTITMMGGSQNVKMYGSLNYLTQDGINKGDSQKYDRYNYRTNVQGTWDKIGITAGLGANGTYTNEHYPNASAYTIYNRIRDRTPFEKAYNEDGTISNCLDNPALILDSPGYYALRTIFTQVTANLTWDLPWVEGLSLGFNGTYNVRSKDEHDWIEKATYYDGDGNATVQSPGDISITRSSYQNHRYDINFRIDYKNTFGKNHNVQATFVHNRNWYHGYSLSASANTFYTNVIQQIQKGDAKSINASNSEGEQTSMGFVGRLHYDFNNRYMIEFAGRYDGSDCFPKGNRFGFFPSVSAGWAISDEPFFKKVKDMGILDYLKVRASYGSIGVNGADHSAYAYLPTYNYNSNAYVIGGSLVNSVTPGAEPSVNMTWYTRKKFDLGVDFTSLNNRLEGSLDYFFETTKGYLSSASYDFIDPIGHSLPLVVSDAEDRSEGLDASLKWKDHIGEFHYNAGFNFTWYHTFSFKTNEDKTALSNPYTRTWGTYRDFYGTGYVGAKLYQNVDEILNNPKRITSRDLRPGDLWYKDVNGDGKIDGNDQRHYGSSSSPRFVFGFDLGASWKGLSILANIQGTGKRTGYLNRNVQAQEGERRLDYKYQLDTWSENNRNASFPRPGNNSLNNSNNYAASDFWAVNTGYVRLKSLTLAYDFKQSLLAKATWLRECSVFVSGVNLFAIGSSTKYSDPEGSLDSYAYPMMRTYSVGVQLGF